MTLSFKELYKEVNFDLIARYLNILAFFVCIYRYAITVGNHRLIISTSVSIEAHLSFFLVHEIYWLNRQFQDELFKQLFSRIFIDQFEEFDILGIEEFPESSALYKFKELLNKTVD